jgi:hypothetical protein
LLAEKLFIVEFNQLPIIAQCIAMVMYLCLLFLIALASYKFFEVRFLRMKDRY